LQRIYISPDFLAGQRMAYVHFRLSQDGRRAVTNRAGSGNASVSRTGSMNSSRGMAPGTELSPGLI
jgi:hypothetical protein